MLLAAAGGIPTTQAAEVTALWDKHCVSCHAKDGSGNTRMGKQSGAKDYRDPAVQAAMKDDAALKILQEGLTEKGKERMKPFKDKLSEDEMKALIAHLRTFKK
jgi:mono/diheme cytochrome c family protein